MQNWNDFQVIIAIAQNQTLSAAARQLGLNQSTISRILKRIESELKVRLFLTSSGAYRVTPEGATYLQVGKEMQKLVATCENTELATALSGIIRLTTVEALVSYLLSRIENFNRQFPGISLELSGSNQNANLPRREFHAALRLHREVKSESFLIKKVGDLGISGYQKRNGKNLSWIGYESLLASIPEEKWLRAKLKTRDRHLKVSSYGAMEKAIEHDLGKGLLPRFMGDRNPNLQCVTGAQTILTRPIWFVTPPNSRHDSTLRVFTKWLFKQFEEDRKLLLGLSV